MILEHFRDDFCYFLIRWWGECRSTNSYTSTVRRGTRAVKSKWQTWGQNEAPIEIGRRRHRPLLLGWASAIYILTYNYNTPCSQRKLKNWRKLTMMRISAFFEYVARGHSRPILCSKLIINGKVRLAAIDRLHIYCAQRSHFPAKLPTLSKGPTAEVKKRKPFLAKLVIRGYFPMSTLFWSHNEKSNKR